MELVNRARERRSLALLALVLVLALLLALGYTVISSRTATDAAVESISEVYLQELSDQVIERFNASVDGRFHLAEAVGASLSLIDDPTEEQARRLLARQQEEDGCAYLALRTDDGRVLTADGALADGAGGGAGAGPGGGPSGWGARGGGGALYGPPGGAFVGHGPVDPRRGTVTSGAAGRAAPGRARRGRCRMRTPRGARSPSTAPRRSFRATSIL
ncbi:hypothetical protein [Arabiibacter massiliensis]|uniref:hypothetical protein n=1 Tax=Arabiibacter massiliensis TaxID=1870985 RepID=UPI00155B28EE|nr:hypothetical protein [Arabiibacter massiliensis]